MPSVLVITFIPLHEGTYGNSQHIPHECDEYRGEGEGEGEHKPAEDHERRNVDRAMRDGLDLARADVVDGPLKKAARRVQALGRVDVVVRVHVILHR